MSKFIELTSGQIGGGKVLFNVEKIIVREDRFGNTSVSIIDGLKEHTIPVEESFEEVKKKLSEC